MPRTIPPAIRCDGRHHLGALLLEGYTIPGQNQDYCAECHKVLPEEIQERCVPFKNEALELDSRDIAEVMTTGTCLQSFPCQHTGVIELKGLQEEEEEDDEDVRGLRLDQILAPMSGIQICRFALIAGRSVDQHFTCYIDRVGPIAPGEVYTIRAGITVRVNDEFVDPRTVIKKIDPKERLYKRWCASFPRDLETFKRELKEEGVW